MKGYSKRSRYDGDHRWRSFSFAQLTYREDSSNHLRPAIRSALSENVETPGTGNPAGPVRRLDSVPYTGLNENSRGATPTHSSKIRSDE